MSDDVKTIKVGRFNVGIIGLDDALKEVSEMGLSPEEAKEKLFEILSAKNYIPPKVSEDYKNAFFREYRRFLGEAIEEEETGLSIKILGRGCSVCNKLMEETMAALAELGIPADVQHVTDPKEIGRFGFVGTPALVVNGKIRSSGRLLLREKIKKIIQEEVENKEG